MASRISPERTIHQRALEGQLEHVERALMRQAAETWVLASAEKRDRVSPYVTAPCTEVTGLIVDRSASRKGLAPFEKLGLGVVRA